MKYHSILLGIAILSVCSSCDQVYISNPQPNDTKNKYSFPRKIQGIWADGSDTIIIAKTYFAVIEYRDKSISKQQSDSSYVIANDLIYFMDEDDGSVLKGGFTYQLKDDTIFYKERSVDEIALGNNNFLRKLGESYIANQKSDDQWWELRYLEITEAGDIIIRVLCDDDMVLISNYTLVYRNEERYGSIHYIEANWTSFELQKWIEAGAFSDTVMVLEKARRIKL